MRIRNSRCIHVHTNFLVGQVWLQVALGTQAWFILEMVGYRPLGSSPGQILTFQTHVRVRTDLIWHLSGRVADPVHFRPDPDPANQNLRSGSRIRILLFKKAHFSCPAYFLHGLWQKKIKKCHLKCPHLETFVVEKCSPVMKFENLKKLNLQIMVL